MSGNNGKKTSRILLTRRFSARANVLGQTRTAVRDCLTTHGCPLAVIEDVILAIDEACQNIIRHAYCGETDQEIDLCITQTKSEIEVRLEDFAPAVRPDCMKPRDLEDIRPGGLGAHLIQEVMDQVLLVPSPQGTGNVLYMTKSMVPNSSP